MKKFFSKTYAPRNRGITLLIAVLVAATFLTIGIAVYQRTYKELYFASFWKQTERAFSSADGGLECALYWDISPSTPATCFGQTVSGGSWVPGSAGSFQVDTYSGCVNVVITKDASGTHTVSRGYNDACGSTNPRRVERGLKIDY
ncbi:MAG: hypothetical protein PHS95_01900 [Candidatus Pacebacteria bacterium]|nr:hypothetical protein [Candidatus Paceibacterota bacterium]